MKHNWEYKRLGEVLIPKKQISRASLKFGRDDSIDYIDISSIDRDNRRIVETTPYVFSQAPSRAQQCVENNDVLLSLVRPNLKNIAIVNDKRTSLVASSGFCVMRSEQLLQRYIFHLVTSEKFTNSLISKCSGATYPAVNDSDVRDIIVPVPQIAVQEQIVQEFDALNDTIAKCKKLLATFDVLTQSLFLETFGDPVENTKGWHISKMKELTTLITNGTTPKGGQAVYVDSGITFFRSQNVWRNKLVMDDIAYLDEDTNASMKGSMLHHNDILITKTGRINTENSSLGRSALFTGGDNTANINGHVYLVRLNETMAPRFVLSILLCNSYRDLIRKVCVGAIDKRQLNLSHIEDFPIITPPLEMQQKFVQQIETIEAEKKKVEATMAEVQTLLDSRMDYWFN